MQEQVTVGKRPFPEVGEIFELTASEEVTGLGLVANFMNQGDTGRWRSNAVTVPSGATKRFKLVRIADEDDLDAVIHACRKQGGRETSGCWLMVFADTFSSNGRNVVLAPDDSWASALGGGVIPVLRQDGSRSFAWAGYLPRIRLWLVEAT